VKKGDWNPKCAWECPSREEEEKKNRRRRIEEEEKTFRLE